MTWFEWIGVGVIGFVCLWIVLLVVVGLRSMAFLGTMIWLAVLHVINPHRARPPTES